MPNFPFRARAAFPAFRAITFPVEVLGETPRYYRVRWLETFRESDSIIHHEGEVELLAKRYVILPGAEPERETADGCEGGIADRFAWLADAILAEGGQ